MSSNGSVWLKNGKVILRGGEVFLYPECPCDCDPKVLGSKVLNGSSENEDEKNKNLNGTCGAFNAYEPIDGCSADECNMAV